MLYKTNKTAKNATTHHTPQSHRQEMETEIEVKT
jgi:hypothetical protein